MKKIKLDTSIYPLIDIQKTIEIFKEYTAILIENENENIIELEFLCEEKCLEKMKNEFCNYLIYVIGSEY